MMWVWPIPGQWIHIESADAEVICPFCGKKLKLRNPYSRRRCPHLWRVIYTFGASPYPEAIDVYFREFR